MRPARVAAWTWVKVGTVGGWRARAEACPGLGLAGPALAAQAPTATAATPTPTSTQAVPGTPVTPERLANADKPAEAGNWLMVNKTYDSNRYSPLKQITPANVGKLQEAWRIQTGDLPTADDPVELTNENTPLQANGIPYTCTAQCQVPAADPDTRIDRRAEVASQVNEGNWKASGCAKTATYVCSGSNFMPGAFRYQCPSSMAAIVTPSTKPPPTGSSQAIAVGVDEDDVLTGNVNQAPMSVVAEISTKDTIPGRGRS